MAAERSVAAPFIGRSAQDAFPNGPGRRRLLAFQRDAPSLVWLGAFKENRAIQMKPILTCSLFLALLIGAAPAMATEVQMICTNNQKTAYIVSFDTKTSIFKTTNPGLGTDLKVRRVQDDSDGVLVWAATAVFGGDRELLAFFGDDKWMKYFYGNGSVQTDPCK
jgi:hypothetical protein